MLDVKLLREKPEWVAEQLKKRGFTLDVATLQAFEAKRKALQIETQELQNKRNQGSKAIGQAKAAGKDGKDVESLMAELAKVNDALKTNEEALETIQKELQSIYDLIPNIPHPSTPVGNGEEENVLVRTWGKPTQFNFEPKDHVALGGEKLDLDGAAKLSGSRFVVLHRELARLHRALAQFMLDLHTREHGYHEIYVPYLVMSISLYGTSQLPKLAEDQFAIKDSDLWLIPTSEVSVTNLARGEILELEKLPLKYVCHSPCFRKEAGSYGKDMKGMFRQHQFDKVEMIQISHPDKSYDALNEMVSHAEAVLQKLKLPYRVMALCTGDIGFAAAKTFDLEVWLPSQGRFREISSCSNTESFQARRMQARFRNPETQKPEFVHTLNGSGLAVGRTFIAVMENYQDEKGNIHIPEALLPYMGGISVIEAKS